MRTDIIKTTFLYKNGEYIGKFDTITAAAKAAKESIHTARGILSGNKIQSKQGYHYSLHKLTDEEINKLPIVEEEYDEDDEDNKFYLPRGKKRKIEELKSFIMTKLTPVWRQQNPQRTILEKRYLNQLLESI